MNHNCGYWLFLLGNVASNEQNSSVTATGDYQLNEEPSHSNEGTQEYKMLTLARVKVVSCETTFSSVLIAFWELQKPLIGTLHSSGKKRWQLIHRLVWLTGWFMLEHLAVNSRCTKGKIRAETLFDKHALLTCSYVNFSRTNFLVGLPMFKIRS